jgi:hypothetical protein
MKTILKAITLSLLPGLVQTLSWAAEGPGFEPVPPAPAAADHVGPKAPSDPQTAEFDRAEQRYRAQLGVATRAPDGAFSDRLQSIVRRASGGFGNGPGTTLVLRSSETSPDAQAYLEEDLAVMSRILDKALEEAPGKFRPSTAMGINLAFAPDPGARMRSLYIEDYGALFLLRVGYPLLPQPPAAREKKQKEPADPAWEEAKQELYGQHPGGGMSPGAIEEFSQERVNKLKEALLESLKSASNIRGLKPEDSVTVCVLGAPGSDHALYGAMSGSGWSPDMAVLGPEQHAASLGSVMTIRVKKADVDSFAKGTVDLEGFHTRVHVEIYPGGGPGRAPFSGTAGGGFGGGGGGFGGVRF